MPNDPLRGARVLVVHPDSKTAGRLAGYLRRQRASADWATDAASAFEAVKRTKYEVLLINAQVGQASAADLIPRLRRELSWRLPVVLMTDHRPATIESNCEVLLKPFSLPAMAALVRNVVQHRDDEVVPPSFEAHGVLGAHSSMVSLHSKIERTAKAKGVVLVTGESGTGKELVVRALHRLGPRRDGPFVALNCGSISPSLIETELFGHVKGAFTDARKDHPGLFREAEGGTLLLDEVGELPMQLQVALLRVLQEWAIRPVGANGEVKVNVRVIAATHRDLTQAVADGTFRSDLYFRLDVLRLDVPPLRARGDDVVLLAEHFLKRATVRLRKSPMTLSPEAVRLLLSHRWPGNVRELQNAIERAVLSCEGFVIEPGHLPPTVSPKAAATVRDGWPMVSLAELERRHIEYVLGAFGGNRQRTAELLGIDRVTLYRKLKKTEVAYRR